MLLKKGPCLVLVLLAMLISVVGAEAQIYFRPKKPFMPKAQVGIQYLSHSEELAVTETSVLTRTTRKVLVTESFEFSFLSIADKDKEEQPLFKLRDYFMVQGGIGAGFDGIYANKDLYSFYAHGRAGIFASACASDRPLELIGMMYLVAQSATERRPYMYLQSSLGVRFDKLEIIADLPVSGFHRQDFTKEKQWMDWSNYAITFRRYQSPSRSFAIKLQSEVIQPRLGNDLPPSVFRTFSLSILASLN